MLRSSSKQSGADGGSASQRTEWGRIGAISAWLMEGVDSRDEGKHTGRNVVAAAAVCCVAMHMVTVT